MIYLYFVIYHHRIVHIRIVITFIFSEFIYKFDLSESVEKAEKKIPFM